ncbi:RHS repeat-associated core domain-containing protein [Clostridium tunisiense]|uniref:RHS repeat-associated core domain-containing protein n=1 Tax=Clostridium tunisiense TaxID=219748 RepID=UPI001FA6AC50|nr:RHS repeat-associated core domain-containing protein [Clostridium tunisiense]
MFGYRYDTENGLYYLQSRYYKPEWGRFIYADALGGQVGELLSHNIFTYCYNEPVNLKDDTAFAAIQAQDGGGGGVSDRNTGNQTVGGAISSNKSIWGRLKETVNYGSTRLKNGLQSGTKSVPNPNGKNGGILNQTTISNIKPMTTNGRMQTEYRYNTPNGTKSYRYADKVEIVDGEVIKIYQCGKLSKNGIPITREAKAIEDIMNSPDYNGAPIYFMPYNSGIGPIIYKP